jgi:hypothetical protein
MRRCFIHIGTHKTGTTALQIVFNRSRLLLVANDILYPTTGRPPEGPNGHHNLAWEISGDRRFRSEYGTIEDLEGLLATAGGVVVLSSEDFECSVYHEGGFDAFLQRLRSHGFQISIVVYLRHQADYAESLYQTMVTHGLPHAFSEFVETILESGRFSWQKWIFPFCYRDFLDRLEAFAETQVIVRSYDRLAHPPLIADFCIGVLGVEPGALGIDLGLRANARAPLIETLRAFCENRKGAALDLEELEVLASLARGLGSDSPPMSLAARRALTERFRDSNAHVCARFGIPPWTEDRRRSSAYAAATTLDGMFSEEIARTVLRTASVIREETSALRRERDSLAAEHASLREALSSMTASSSWRMTAPLRRARRALTSGWHRLAGKR